MGPMCADACRFAAGSEQQHLNTGKRQAGWCSTLTVLLICSSFSREYGHPLLICSSLSTAQQGISAIEFLHALKCERHSLSGTSGQSAPTIMFIKLNEKNTLSAEN